MPTRRRQRRLSPAQHSPHGTKESHRPDHPDQGRTTRCSSPRSGPGGSRRHGQREAALLPEGRGPSWGTLKAARSLTAPEPAAPRKAGSAASASGKTAAVADAPPASPWRKGNAPLPRADRRARPAAPRGLQARCFPPAFATATSSEPKPPSSPVGSRPHKPAPPEGLREDQLTPRRRGRHPGLASPSPPLTTAGPPGRRLHLPAAKKSGGRGTHSTTSKATAAILFAAPPGEREAAPADGYTRLPSNAARSCPSALRKRHLRCTAWRLSGVAGSSRASTSLRPAALSAENRPSA